MKRMRLRTFVTNKAMLWTSLPVLVTAAAFGVVCSSAFGWRQAPQDPEFAGPAATVGNPNQPDSLGEEIVDAYSRGARRISIRPGTYRFGLLRHSVIDLSRWKDARIYGRNATLISSETEWGNELIHMSECTNVEIDDLTLSQTWQTALQGRVTGVSSDAKGGTLCTWRPDAGYPAPPPGAVRFNKGPNIVDAKTRLLKHGCADEWGAGIQPLGDGAYRVGFGHKVNVEVGDWLVSRGAVAPCKVHLVFCRGCALSNITLLRNAFGSVMENEGGGNSYIGCTWQLGPKPAEAIEKPLVTCSVDAFHSVNCYPGPDLEKCNFTGVFLDDCITIHGVLQQVKSSNGDTIVVDGDGGKLKVGQPVRLGSPGFFANDFVKELHSNGDHMVTIKLSRDLNVPVGAMVSNPLWNGQSFKVLGCILGFTRSRGILVKADEGLIADNTISECGGSAINAGPEYPWKEGDYVQDLSIKNNQIRKNGCAGHDVAAVWVHGEGAKGNHNITIESNTFESNYSGDVNLDWTSVATIRQNSFSPPTGPPPGLSLPHSIVVKSSSDVEVSRNNFKDIAGYRQPPVVQGPDVQNFRNELGR